MNRQTITILIVLFLLVVAGMFLFTSFKSDEIDQSEQDPESAEPSDTADTPDQYGSITMVTAKHFFEDGVHTFAGEIPMPTPCDLLEATALVRESDPEQIEIAFTVTNNAETCVQVITQQRFKVSAEASEEATASASLEGRSVRLNLVEAAPYETPESYQIFIKG